MNYQLAKLLPLTDSHYVAAPNDDEAKDGAVKFLHDQPPGAYLLVSLHPTNGTYEVVAAYGVKTATKVEEILARFEL